MEAADRDAGSEKVRRAPFTVNEFRPGNADGPPIEATRPLMPRRRRSDHRAFRFFRRNQPPLELSFRMIASTRTIYWFALLISPCA